MKWAIAFLPGFALTTMAWSQPPLPPAERAWKAGVVLTLSEADGLTLVDGTAAPIAEGVRFEGVAALTDVAPGDLVETLQDDNGLVTGLRVIPHLADWRPLVEVAQAGVLLPRFWWQHDGQEYPDSLYAADLSIPLQTRVTAFRAIVAYRASANEGRCSFALLDGGDTVVWEQLVAPGETVDVYCGPEKGSGLTLRCRKPDGSVPDHTQCVWGSPTVLMPEYGEVPLSPRAAADVVASVAGNLGQIDPGRVVVAAPRALGLSSMVARELQDDLLVALGRRYALAGTMQRPATTELTDADVQAAQSLKADTVAVGEIRYQPDGATVRVALVDTTTRETLARAETKLEP